VKTVEFYEHPDGTRHYREWEDGMLVWYAVKQKSTGLYLRMSKFDPDTKLPRVGPATQAWITTEKLEAVGQAGWLGEDWDAVQLVVTIKEV
jgi:hypothetical protein